MHIVVLCTLLQARETLKVILERQKKQRDEMITQVQRYVHCFYSYAITIDKLT